MKATDHLWLTEKLVEEIGATALVVCDREQVIMTMGSPAVAVHCQSIRNSLLGALYGRHVLNGTIDLDATLAELDISDSVPPVLNDTEQTARVRDLLTCRSGIYHTSNHQTLQGRADLPPRGTYQPGTHFLYNNWDFDTLGTILERSIGRSLFDEFAETIARPAQMQDFYLSEQRYAIQTWSEHRTYAFHLSTRDLARFGQLYLNEGRFQAQEVIPPSWVADSTCAHTPTDRDPSGTRPAFGYLWWVAQNGHLFEGTRVPDGSFAAYGKGGQFLLIIPALNRVIALLADPTRPGGTARSPRHSELVELVHHATDGALPLLPLL